MKIRTALPDDAAALCAIARSAKAHWGYPSDWLALWQADLTISPAYIETQAVFVAEQHARIVALCALEEFEANWSLEHLWVHPEVHGRGIGSALVRVALEFVAAKRLAPVRVVSDPQAAGFYERLGAQREGSQAAPMPRAPDRTLPIFVFFGAADA